MLSQGGDLGNAGERELLPRSWGPSLSGIPERSSYSGTDVPPQTGLHHRALRQMWSYLEFQDIWKLSCTTVHPLKYRNDRRTRQPRGREQGVMSKENGSREIRQLTFLLALMTLR